MYRAWGRAIINYYNIFSFFRCLPLSEPSASEGVIKKLWFSCLFLLFFFIVLIPLLTPLRREPLFFWILPSHRNKWWISRPFSRYFPLHLRAAWGSLSIASIWPHFSAMLIYLLTRRVAITFYAKRPRLCSPTPSLSDLLLEGEGERGVLAHA